MKESLTKEFDITGGAGGGAGAGGGGGGVDNNLCRCFHCDYSRLGVLLDDGSCHLSARQTAGPTLVNCCVTMALSSLYIRAPPTPLLSTLYLAG